ncbi:MAG: hypothetical protein KKE12_20355, partial [Proteobacteria bacterium]|nr:hypothetical protein [Pseudomonadota bacterium]
CPHSKEGRHIKRITNNTISFNFLICTGLCFPYNNSYISNSTFGLKSLQTHSNLATPKVESVILSHL